MLMIVAKMIDTHPIVCHLLDMYLRLNIPSTNNIEDMITIRLQQNVSATVLVYGNGKVNATMPMIPMNV
jgi:hypothetical protein